MNLLGFQGSSVVKNPPANAGDLVLVLGLRKSPGGGNGNPLQYSCLGNPTDRGAWRATVHRVAKESDRTQQVNKNNNVYVHLLLFIYEREGDTQIQTLVQICTNTEIFAYIINKKLTFLKWLQWGMKQRREEK